MDFKFLPAVVLPLLCAGCSWIRDDIALSNQRGFEKATHFDYASAFTRFTGLRELAPGPDTREQTADARLCLHPNGEERVLMQDGVSDQVVYRRCAVSPYPSDMGTRIGNRPEPQDIPN